MCADHGSKWPPATCSLSRPEFFRPKHGLAAHPGGRLVQVVGNHLDRKAVQESKPRRNPTPECPSCPPAPGLSGWGTLARLRLPHPLRDLAPVGDGVAPYVDDGDVV